MGQDFNLMEWITTKEAAELTGYSPVTLRQFAREGRIEGCKRGRDWFLSKEDVVTYVEEMEQLGTAKHDPTRKREADRS
jgi:excisionase family DNA binding protein